VERCYRLDEDRLTSAFRAITRNIHPDRFGGEPEQVCALSTRLSAELNQAYGVLKDPVQRADYMLEQAGGPSAAQVREVPGDLLAEVMMLREEVEEAHAAGDSAAIDRLRLMIANRRTTALADIADHADHLDTANDDAKVECRKLINSINYFDNLLAELAADPLGASLESRHDGK
jgi:molecular chaperone HscB